MYACRLELIDLLENYLSLLQSQYGDNDHEITRVKLWLWAIDTDARERNQLQNIELNYLLTEKRYCKPRR